MKHFSAILTILVAITLFVHAGAWGQSEADGNKLLREGQEFQKKAQSRHDLEKALKKYEEALTVFEKAKSEKGQGTSLHSIGLVYKNLGQYNKALEYYEKSLAVKRKLGDTKGEGIVLTAIGLVYGDTGQYVQALEYYKKSLAIRKNIGDVNGEATTLNNIGLVCYNLGQFTKALGYYEKSLELKKKVGDIKDQGAMLSNIGLVYNSLGQYTKAIEYHDKSLEISMKVGDIKGQGVSLNNLGAAYINLGKYAKALEYYEKSLASKKKLGDIKGEAITLNNMGLVYVKIGQHSRALQHFEKSLEISTSIGDAQNQGTTLNNIGWVYAQQDKYNDAINFAEKSLSLKKKIGVPTKKTIDLIANYYLDAGNTTKAEPLVKKTGYNSTQGRLALSRSDYSSAITYYTKDVSSAEKTGNADALFRSYTGLGRAYEGMENFEKAEEFYTKAMKVIEEIRSGLAPSERKNFFEVKVSGFKRSEPAKSLTRVRMKLNQPDGSIESSEVTRARSFAEHIAQSSSAGSTGVPTVVIEKELSLVSKVAALKKELSKVDRQNEAARHEILSNEVRESEADLNFFVEDLWKRYPSYAAVKYPRPVTLKDCGLKPEEYAVIFDASDEGVSVKLIYNKEINQTFYIKWHLEEMEKDIKKLREPMEKLRFKAFDVDLASKLYRRLLQRALLEVPKGAPLIIIPDGILAILPFEALVTEGTAIWQKAPLDGYPDELRDYPGNVTFLGDEHPISYYQSITALTLARTLGKKVNPQNRTLVLADPVFSNKDNRAQQASGAKMAESEKNFNIELMKAIEEDDEINLSMKRLPRTLLLAEGLQKIYGNDCLALTGLKANKSDFMSKMAPGLEAYRNLVFATHGVMSTKIPGLMEPFLALTMAPPGTDGFLKMSDILSLKMNADVVALTACQTGLGKDLSGEGVMSMGRAFQYAGAKSVLMTLWEVEEASAIKLTEKFFQHRKDGKSKLEALQLARDQIKKEGYRHPYFWGGFVLVGEAM
ncbi:MAG: tetratricopeptide repeat protein [Syntrophaceae bacterium]|nr:tetratricopeptide repeat protein [Syntrophaceae bacterium]